MKTTGALYKVLKRGLLNKQILNIVYCIRNETQQELYNWRIKNYLSQFPLMQTANVKGKDETYARRLHCLPLCCQPQRRSIMIVSVSLGACHRCRLSVWRS